MRHFGGDWTDAFAGKPRSYRFDVICRSEARPRMEQRGAPEQMPISVYIEMPLPKAQGFAYPFRCI
ncbi:hypothetical protein AM274_16555 [Pseudomonas nunensis]|nr:hypothetical protein AM274_16555 [Pseudomonas nunensis]